MSSKIEPKSLTDDDRDELKELRTRSKRLGLPEEQADDAERCAAILHKFKNEFTITELRLECRRIGIPIPHPVALA